MNRTGITPWMLSFPVVLTCGTALLFTQRNAEQPAPQRSSHSSILGNVRKDLGAQWLFIDSRLCLGKEFHVKRVPRDDGTVRLAIDDFFGLARNMIDIDLWKLDDEKPWVEASIVWLQDTQPFQTPWTDVSGQVWISSMDWTGKTPVVVHFDLRGMRDGTAHSASGEVKLPP